MKKIFAIILSVALLAGCYKSEFHTTNHPEEAKLTFVVDFGGSDPEDGGYSLADIGGEFTILFDKEEYQLTDEEPLTIPYLLEPGSYTYYIYTKVYNVADPLSYSKSTTETTSAADFAYYTDSHEIIASVATETGDTETIVYTADHDLYFGTAVLNLKSDTDYTVTPTIYPETGGLDIKLKLEGDSNDQLAAVTGTLTGVATDWDCINDTPYGSTATLQLVFDILKEGDDYYIHSTSTILGFSGSEQVLTLTLVYNNGNPASHTITSDLASDIATFNDNKSETFYLTNTYDVPNETSTGGVITGWNPEDEGDVEVK